MSKTPEQTANLLAQARLFWRGRRDGLTNWPRFQASVAVTRMMAPRGDGHRVAQDAAPNPTALPCKSDEIALLSPP